MKLAPKPQHQNVTKVDYLTVTFCPAEIQRLKTMAKWHVSTGEYNHYREAYNALICAEVFDENGTDDFDIVTETKRTTDRFYTDESEKAYNDLFDNNKRYPNNMPHDEKIALCKVVVKKTQKYKVLDSLIEGELQHFLTLLNTVVATKADRMNADEQPWTIRQNTGGMFTYDHSATLYRHGVNSGIVAWGANNAGCMVSFSGTGCKGLDLTLLHKMLSKMPHAKITRLDIAYDDYQGEIPVDEYLRQYEMGNFALTNQMPNWSYICGGTYVSLSKEQQTEFKKKHGWQKKYDLVPNAGSTLYVGSRSNGKMFRAYEKGRQMECETNPNWVRAELELRATDRTIPLDALINTDAVFAAAYPALAFVSEKRLVIETTKRKKMDSRLVDIRIQLEATEQRLFKYHKLAYGKCVNYMKQALQLSDSEIVKQLTKGLAVDDMPTKIRQTFVMPPNFNQTENIPCH
ncbi:replication initiation factor domain-containing protein [Pseudoalteromonas sp. T1lg24]|uniref:replication initiation factor domain-containing protein n=1 Tax=Pseudoalteromonas sp. T1lg24 TaxID=2077099 RepID=UPI000CF685D1|nr:replication initiation factor domain-containing protein [Pseudoalteromonas sp. T1lg24]